MFGEAFGIGMDQTIGIGQYTGSVEHHFVLTADGIEIGDGSAGFLHAAVEEQIALGGLAVLERRGVRYQHQLRTGGHALGDRFGEPDIFADDHAERNALDCECARIAIGGKIAALVEYRVVGQFLLVVYPDNGTILDDVGGIEYHRTQGTRRRQHHGDALNLRGDFSQGTLAIGEEAGAQQQIFRWVTAQRQFRKQQHIGAGGFGLFHQAQDFRGSVRERTDRKIVLRHRQSEGVIHAAIVKEGRKKGRTRGSPFSS